MSDVTFDEDNHGISPRIRTSQIAGRNSAMINLLKKMGIQSERTANIVLLLVAVFFLLMSFGVYTTFINPSFFRAKVTKKTTHAKSHVVSVDNTAPTPTSSNN